MERTFREEFERSWLTSLIGLFVFCIGIYLLTWNEGKAVHHHHSLEETCHNAVSLNPFDRLQPEYDGQVVHISGALIVDEPLTEPEYGISIQAVKLKRRVQIYQWVEETTPREDYNDDIVRQQAGKDYYYITEWRDKIVDSSNFYIRHGHENPKEKPLQTITYITPYANVGPLALSEDLKDKFMDFEELTGDERPDRKDIKLHVGLYYHCRDVWNPEVGDIRVGFSYAGATGDIITVIAKQEKGTLVPYTTSKGEQVALLRYGRFNVAEMAKAEHRDAAVATWKLRFYGAIFIYFSVLCWSRLLKITFTHIPYLTNIISGEATDKMNFFVAGSVALFIIALAWILYRPVIGASLIFAAFSPFFYCFGAYCLGPPLAAS